MNKLASVGMIIFCLLFMPFLLQAQEPEQLDAGNKLILVDTTIIVPLVDFKEVEIKDGFGQEKIKSA